MKKAFIVLLIYIFSLPSCKEAPEAPLAEGEDKPPGLKSFKKEVDEIENQLDGFQAKLQKVMEDLKNQSDPDAPVKLPPEAQPSDPEKPEKASPKPEVKEKAQTKAPTEDLEVKAQVKAPATKRETPAKVSKKPSRVAKTRPPQIKSEKKNAPPAGEKISPVADTAKLDSSTQRAELDSKEGPDFFDLGLQSWYANDRKQAIQHFLKSIKAEPENAHAYWNLALLYDGENKGPQAIAMLERAEEIYRANDQREDSLKARQRLLAWYKKYVYDPAK